jgi:GDPmannose 4,6-dehydratase
MVSFITGINGQDGSYLSELLLEKGYHVHGIVRRTSTMNTTKIEHLLSNKNFTYNYGDVTDYTSIYNNIESLIKKHPGKIIEVYHLAAQSHVKVSFEVPEYTTQVVAIGTLKLLEVCKKLQEVYNVHIRIYNACTSELYGSHARDSQNEETPFNPSSPYAIAKQYSFYMAKNYRESYQMYVCNGILFNHESPRRGENFVTRKISLGVAKIYRGESECIVMGNIDSTRDWGHAQDYVRAMYMMLQHDTPDDYVIATNETHTVREFIEKAFLEINKTITWVGDVGKDQDGIVRVKVDSKYFRPTEVPYLKGDSSKAKRILGWIPENTFDELVKIMVKSDLT